MGKGKSEANRRAREGKTGDGNLRVKGENFYRSAKRVKQLKIFKDGKPQRNADGKIVQSASYQSRDVPTAVIEPNRKWFQNTRVISQESLTTFRTAMAEQTSDPYRVLLKSNKLPMSLIRDPPTDTTHGVKKHRAKTMVETEPFSEVLRRKRVRLDVSNLDDLVEGAEKNLDTYKERREQAMLLSGNAGDTEARGEHAPEEEPELTTAKEPVFSKGQSKRIWNELYRTIDSSDVVVCVLDARDPLGTRCTSVEEYLRKEAPHKHLVFVLNKVDLVPSKVAAGWLKVLQKTAPTCAFRSSVKNPFGRGSLISLLRQFSSLHSDRKQISVGCIGYPNVGKSSLINTLRGKKTCVTAPIPGCTKVWQYVTLMKRIFLIDCPGIVPPENASAADILLRGAVRTEKVENPAQYMSDVMARVKRHHLARTYDIKDWEDPTDFLNLLARKRGRLLAGGEPDIDGIARIVLNDFLRGRIPWFRPPLVIDEMDDEGNAGDRQGRLGEMPRKRKREDMESVADSSAGVPDLLAGVKTSRDPPRQEEDDEFEGFGSDSAPDLESDSADDDDSLGDDVISLGVSSEEEGDGDEDDEGASLDGESGDEEHPASLEDGN